MLEEAVEGTKPKWNTVVVVDIQIERAWWMSCEFNFEW